MVWKNIRSSFIWQDIDFFVVVQRTSFNIFHHLSLLAVNSLHSCLSEKKKKNNYFAFVLKRCNWKTISTLEMPLHGLCSIATVEKLFVCFFFTKCVFLFFFGYFQDLVFSAIAVVFFNFIPPWFCWDFWTRGFIMFTKFGKTVITFFKWFYVPSPSRDSRSMHVTPFEVFPQFPDLPIFNVLFLRVFHAG